MLKTAVERVYARRTEAGWDRQAAHDTIEELLRLVQPTEQMKLPLLGIKGWPDRLEDPDWRKRTAFDARKAAGLA